MKQQICEEIELIGLNVFKIQSKIFTLGSSKINLLQLIRILKEILFYLLMVGSFIVCPFYLLFVIHHLFVHAMNQFCLLKYFRIEFMILSFYYGGGFLSFSFRNLYPKKTLTLKRKA